MDAYALSLKFQTEGFDDVFRKLDQVDQKGARTAQTAERSGASIERIGHKAAGVAIALSGMETVGVNAMEKIAHGATNIAFMFGTAGPIVGALAIAGVAIYNIFQQARKEMEATDKKARDLLRGLSLSTGVSTSSTLYGGDPFAKAGSPEQLGIAAAKARSAAIWAMISGPNKTQNILTSAQFAELKALGDWLKEAEPLYARVRARTLELAAANVELDQNLIKIASDTEAATAAERARRAAEAAAAAAYVPPVHGKMPGVSMVTSGGQAQENALGPIGARAAIVLTQAQAALLAMVQRVQDQMGDIIQYGFAQTLGDAIYNGFAAAFSGKGISGLLKSFGKTILAGIGQTFTQLGQVYLQYGVLMQGLAAFLPNPFTAGWAGVAIGAALIAMGAALGAVGKGGAGGAGSGGGGYSASGSYNNTQESVTRIRLMPGWAGQGSEVSARPTVQVFANIIGPNDPQAQRDIKALINNAERRGL